eukprot:g5202.t1
MLAHALTAIAACRPAILYWSLHFIVSACVHLGASTTSPAMLQASALALLCGLAAARESVGGWGDVKNALVHKVLLDSRGYACDSLLSNRTECPVSRRGIQNHRGTAYARWCDVNSPDAARCVEPSIIEAGSEYEIQKELMLMTVSDPGGKLHRKEKVVYVVDLTMRSEYKYKYTVQDTAGKVVKVIQFHLFIVDHEPPVLSPPTVEYQTQHYNKALYTHSQWAHGIARMDDIGDYHLPVITALDGYDGDVSDHVSVMITDAHGSRFGFSNQSTATIKLVSFGHHMVEYTARDRAGYFGLNYKDNGATRLANVHVYRGRVDFRWVGTRPPTPRPTPPPSPALPKKLPTFSPTPAPTPPHCIMSDWSGWSRCTAGRCGRGTQQRTRSIKVLPGPRGNACPMVREQVKDCTGPMGWNARPCSPWCEYTWGKWTQCNKKCGGGVQMHRAIVTKPIGRCPAAELRVCNPKPCPTKSPTPVPTLHPTPASWRVSDMPVPTPAVINMVVGLKEKIGHEDKPRDPLIDKQKPLLSLDLGKEEYLLSSDKKKVHKLSELTYYQTYAQDHTSDKLLANVRAGASARGWFVAAGAFAISGVVLLGVAARRRSADSVRTLQV